jgi:hypothetical protein
MSRASSRHEFQLLDSNDGSVPSRQSWYPPSENTAINQDVSLWQIGYLSTARIIGYVLAFFALLFSVAAIVVFTLTRKHADGSAILQVESFPLTSGSCDSNLHTYNLIAHLFINLLGTIILGSSNYLQQICTSPSVTGVTKQLKRHGDVKFGANSPSAVFRQRSTLTMLWLSLVITSLPIHIMLNGIMGYAVFPIDASGQAIESGASGIATYVSENTTWTEISSSQCVTYLLNAVAYVTDFNNITIIVNPGANLDYYNSYMQFTSSDTLLGQVPIATDVANCYVQFVDSQCELTVRWFPLFCTATALLIKTLIVFIAIRRHAHFRKRVFNSLGDMIALGARHPQLRQYCHGKTPGMFSGPYTRQRTRWVRALGGWDVLVAIFWWVSALGVMIYGIVSWVSVGWDLDISSRIKAFGLGTINPSTSFVPGNTDVLAGTPNTFPIQVIIANSPQLWLSFGYLLWNNQITRIWMEREWRSYYRKTHVPRVSYRTDETGVRATRWLQLPYWLTAILMTLSTVMHWLVSQTMFVVEILGSPGYFYMNYSPLAIIGIGVVATVLVLGITIYYFVPLRTWMPLMAGSARVVFESCVRLDSSSLPVGGIAWGDVSTPRERLAGFGEIVGPLVKGVMYPGLIAEEHQHNLEYMFSKDSDTEPLVRRY